MKRSDLDVATDRLFLGGDEDWPAYPMLPVKHTTEKDSNGFPLLGLLLAYDKQTIYLANMYTVSKETLDSCERRTFTDRESMILRGWVVN